MKSRTTNIIYWIITVLFALMMILDGIAGVLRVEDGKISMAKLGYPEYLLTILGIAKISGAIALLQPVSRTVKEWSYAGFVFIFIGASISHAFAGSAIGFLVLPIVLLAIMFVSYFLGRKIESEKL